MMEDGEFFWYELAVIYKLPPDVLKVCLSETDITRWKIYLTEKAVQRTSDQNYLAQIAYQIHVCRASFTGQKVLPIENFHFNYNTNKTAKRVVNKDTDTSLPSVQEWVEYHRNRREKMSPEQAKKVSKSKQIWKAVLLGTKVD